MTRTPVAERPSGAALTVALLTAGYYTTPLIAALVVPGRQFGHLQLVALLVPGLVALASLWWLRQRMVAVVALVLACSVPSPLALGAALVVVAHLAATRTRGVAIGVAAAFTMVKGLNVFVLSPDTGLASPATRVEWFLASVALLIALFVGWLNASNREAARRAAEAEQARSDLVAAQVNEARMAERERIAREMHDVVAHRISLVALHAGALAHGMAAHQAEGSDELAMVRLIQGNAQASLDELRAMLGRLRGADAPPEPPQPSLAAVGELVRDARAAGQQVELVTAGAISAAPERVSRHAYRIAQEALTNARKHAPGSPVRLELIANGTTVRVVASNALTRLALPDHSGSGLGLVGVAERVEQLGGRLWHGERDGRFVLDAELPSTSGGVA